MKVRATITVDAELPGDTDLAGVCVQPDGNTFAFYDENNRRLPVVVEEYGAVVEGRES